jgi:hypothetical protein
MNIRNITVATLVVLTAAGSCWAQEAESDAWMRLESSSPRASVRAERDTALAAARQSHVVDENSWMQSPGVRTRAAVRAELQAARASGEFQRINAEAVTFDDPARPTTRLARSTR